MTDTQSSTLLETEEKAKRNSPNAFSEKALKPLENEIEKKLERIAKLEIQRDLRVRETNDHIAVLRTSIDKAKAMLEEFRKKAE